MSVRGETLLWLAQRVSAAALGLLVLVHLGTMVYAVQGGLSATEILSRTRGSAIWGAFYGLFVLMVAVHAPIGMRNVLAETFGWRGRGLGLAMLALGLFLLAFGARAVWAVVVTP